MHSSFLQNSGQNWLVKDYFYPLLPVLHFFLSPITVTTTTTSKAMDSKAITEAKASFETFATVEAPNELVVVTETVDASKDVIVDSIDPFQSVFDRKTVVNNPQDNPQDNPQNTESESLEDDAKKWRVFTRQINFFTLE